MQFSQIGLSGFISSLEESRSFMVDKEKKQWWLYSSHEYGGYLGRHTEAVGDSFFAAAENYFFKMLKIEEYFQDDSEG